MRPATASLTTLVLLGAVVAVASRFLSEPWHEATNQGISVCGLHLGDSLDRAKQLFPDLSSLGLLGGCPRRVTWGPKICCDSPRVLEVVDMEPAVVAVVGFTLEVRSKKFHSGDPLSRVVELLGRPPLVVAEEFPPIERDRYSYPELHLSIIVNRDDHSLYDFSLGGDPVPGCTDCSASALPKKSLQGCPTG